MRFVQVYRDRNRRNTGAFRITVENRDYHHLSQNATIPGPRCDPSARGESALGGISYSLASENGPERRQAVVSSGASWFFHSGCFGARWCEVEDLRKPCEHGLFPLFCSPVRYPAECPRAHYESDVPDPSFTAQLRWMSLWQSAQSVIRFSSVSSPSRPRERMWWT
jgi:hypothetical protein